MEKLTFPELKVLVDLILCRQPLLSSKEIQENICKYWNKDVSLDLIYKVLDNEFHEDFELETNKLKHYGGTVNIS